jgi:hypothetical protein
VRRIPEKWHTPPIAIGMSVDAALPIVGAAHGAPEGLEAVRNELLAGIRLLVGAEVRGQELVPAVGEGAEAAAGAAPRLLAEPAAEELRVVQNLCSAVGEHAIVPAGAAHALVVVKAIPAGLAAIAEAARPPSSVGEQRAASVTAAVEEGATSVVVR